MRAADMFNARRILKWPELLAQIAFAMKVPNVVASRPNVQ